MRMALWDKCTTPNNLQEAPLYTAQTHTLQKKQTVNTWYVSTGLSSIFKSQILTDK